MQGTGFKEYLETDGNQGVVALRRSVGDRVEFLFLSFWESIEAVRPFAGEDYGRAVFYPEDDTYLIDRDLHVDHYEVVAGQVPFQEMR
jgi:heme-degrading monooxygenase HmoA